MRAMPLQVNAKAVDTSVKSILIGRIKIRNDNKPGYQPELLAVFLEQGEKYYSFTDPTLISEVEGGAKDYLFSVAVEPGEVQLNQFRFLYNAIVLSGLADLQFDRSMEVPAGSIVYIGNIDAVIVSREEGQPRAGSIIPLIDQAVTGFSSGTFSVNITDNFGVDRALFVDKFSYLSGRNIERAVLSQWRHPDPEN